MAQREEGWPLGLQPLNVRAGLVGNRDLINGSLSFNTLLTSSPPVSSSASSSDLDTESTCSFFHDRSITLGSLIGVSNFLDLSRRSARGRIIEPAIVRSKKTHKSRTWFLSLCSRLSTDAVSMSHAPSFGQFLETERRGANSRTRNSTTDVYGPDDFSHDFESNSLFDGGRVAPRRRGSWLNNVSDEGTLRRELMAHSNAEGRPLVLWCLCGNTTGSG